MIGFLHNCIYRRVKSYCWMGDIMSILSIPCNGSDSITVQERGEIGTMDKWIALFEGEEFNNRIHIVDLMQEACMKLICHR